MIPLVISSLIEQILRETKQHPNDSPANDARRHGAIPLMGDIGGTWMLRPDGSIWELPMDSERAPHALDESKRLMALAVGARRYPWLSVLLPEPAGDAKVCAACCGVGEIYVSADRTKGAALCGHCHTLGWRAG